MYPRSLFLDFILFLVLYDLPYTFCRTTQKPLLDNYTDEFINKMLADWKSPGGISVAIVRRDDTGAWNVETKGYGVATANGTKVTENTRFAIGSNSKLFNIFAVGLLIHNETISPRLNWDTKMVSIVPGWDLVDSIAAQRATIVDLMSHRTGVPRHDFSYRLSDDISTIIQKTKFLRPSAEFRDVYQYSNSMYMILSYLPSLLSSKIPFARYVKQHIFDPLGMSSTTYSYELANKSGQLADGMARQHINASDDLFSGIPRALPFWSTSGGEDGNAASGSGGVISNAVDMATWLQTLLLEGVKPGTNISIIPADVVQRAATGVSILSGKGQFPEVGPVVYGAGQERGTYRGYEIIEHSGTVPGFHSIINRLPSKNLGVAVLTNDNDYGSMIARIVEAHLLDVAFGLEPVDWNSRLRNMIATASIIATPRPANVSSPSIGLASLAGIYYNGGYGSFELCLVSSQNSAASPSCEEMVTSIPTILPGATNHTIPTFIAKWDGPAFSHIRMSHFNGDIFNVSGLASYPTGNALEPYWTYGDSNTDTGIYAQIFVEGHRIGVGITGIWGAEAGVTSPQGNTVRERAEVWFDKV